MGIKIIRTEEDEAAGAPLDLAAAISEFYTEFPAHRADVFFVNHQAQPTAAAALQSLLPELQRLADRHPELKGPSLMMRSLVHGAVDAQMPCSINLTPQPFMQDPSIPIYARFVVPAGPDFSARVLKSIFTGDDPVDNTRFPVMAPAFNNTEMWQRYVLDHEIGHAVTQRSMNAAGGYRPSQGNRAECEADAYAMIRHFQRYGQSSGFPAYVRDLRTMGAVMKGGGTHYTAAAIDAVIALNAKGMLAALSPEKSRDLAMAIAAKVHISPAAERNITRAYAANRSIIARARETNMPDGDHALTHIQSICRIGATTESAAVHGAAKRFMSVYAAYIPPNAPSQFTRAALDAIAADLKTLRNRSVTGEPPVGHGPPPGSRPRQP